MTPSPTSDISDTLRTPKLHKRELVALLSEKYGMTAEASHCIDRTGLQRIADAFDFLSNNLPPASLASHQKAK